MGGHVLVCFVVGSFATDRQMAYAPTYLRAHALVIWKYGYDKQSRAGQDVGTALSSADKKSAPACKKHS